MRKVCLPSKKLPGQPYISRRAKALFRRTKYNVTLGLSRVRLTRLVRTTNLTGGLQSNQKSHWRTGPKGHKYVFISARDIGKD